MFDIEKLTYDMKLHEFTLVSKCEKLMVFKKHKNGFVILVEVCIPAYNFAECKMVTKKGFGIFYDMSIAQNAYDILDYLVDMWESKLGGNIIYARRQG